MRRSGYVPLTSVTFRASSTATSATITLPAGAAAGDFCLIVDVVVDSGGVAPAAVTPSGWSNGSSVFSSSNATNSVRFFGYWKVLTAADISAGNVTGGDGTTADAKMAFCFKPNIGAVITTATINAGSSTSLTNAAVSMTVDATGAATPNALVGFIMADTGTPVFTGVSPAFDAEVGVARIKMGYKINASASHGFGQGDTGNRNYVGGAYFTFT
jgi:hypothetical protein